MQFSIRYRCISVCSVFCDSVQDTEFGTIFSMDDRVVAVCQKKEGVTYTSYGPDPLDPREPYIQAGQDACPGCGSALADCQCIPY